MTAARWWQFVKERFPPLEHGPMIAVVVVAHMALLGAPWWTAPFLLVGVAAFLFQLRLYDEIKDFDDDKRDKPHRPLVRGLVTHGELHRAIVLCTVVELFAFAQLGPGALVGVVVAAAYRLLLFKELFVGAWLRPRLLRYALVHTPVSALLTLAIAAGATSTMPWELPSEAYLLAGTSFLLFTVFELLRKSFATVEETRAESYSRRHGRHGAVLLAVACCAAAATLLGACLDAGLAVALICLLVVVAAAGLVYAARDTRAAAKVYRGAGSLYLLGAYLACASSALWS